LHIGPSHPSPLFFFLGHMLLCSAPSTAGAVPHPWPPLCCRRRSTSCLIDLHASLFPCPSPISPLRCPRLHAPRLPGALLGRHRAVTVESPLQNPRTLSLTGTSTTRAPTFRSPGFSANFQTPASSSTAAPLFFHSGGSCSSWVATINCPLLPPTP
jgi:hypothetical protein